MDQDEQRDTNVINHAEGSTIQIGGQQMVTFIKEMKMRQESQEGIDVLDHSPEDSLQDEGDQSLYSNACVIQPGGQQQIVSFSSVQQVTIRQDGVGLQGQMNMDWLLGKFQAIEQQQEVQLRDLQEDKLGSQHTLDQMRTEIQQLNQDNENLEKRVQTLAKEKEATQQEQEVMKHEIRQLQKEKQTLQAEVSKRKKSEKRLNNHVRELMEEKENQDEGFDQLWVKPRAERSAAMHSRKKLKRQPAFNPYICSVKLERASSY